MRPPAAHCRFAPPSEVGSEPRTVAGACHSRRPSPVATSAVQTPQRTRRCASKRVGCTPSAGRADERDASSVRRPARCPVTRGRRREPADRRRVVRVDPDECVVAAVGDERQARPVRRPLRLFGVTVRGEEAAGWRRAIHGHRPDRVVADECHGVARGGHGRLVAVPQELRLGRQRMALTRPESSARPVVKAGWETRRSNSLRDRRRARTRRIGRRASAGRS